MSALEGASFTTYNTSVGGSGLGILSPYHEHDAALATPPETPCAQTPPAEPASLKERFRSVDVGELPRWAEERGRWLYV